MRAILFLIRKEYLQIFRDKPTVFQILFIPIVQLLVLSNAATFELANARMHLVDLDRTTESRRVVEHLVASGRFSVAEQSASMDRANADLLNRRVSVILRIPHDFERDLVRTGTAPVQLVLNAEEGASAGILQSYAVRILMQYQRELDRALRPDVRTVRFDPGENPPPRRGEPRIDVRLRGWFNATLKYKYYMVPGLLVSLVTIIGTLLTAQNIAREKEMGTLEQLNVTPITKGQFIAGKLLPFWLLALVTFSIGLLMARWVFGVPMRGSLVLVFFSAAVYLVVALGIGLWISAITNTQQQTLFVAFFIMMIYMMMSGLFTPIESMPTWAQWIAQINPVKHFVVIMRAILLKGAGIVEIAAPLGILAVYGVVVLSFAIKQYSKTTG